MGGEKEFERKDEFRTQEMNSIGILLADVYRYFKIPLCQRILSLVKLRWFKLLVKLGLSFRSDAYKVF